MAVQWRLLCDGLVVGGFTEPAETDSIVTGLRNAWAAGEYTSGTVTIQVNHGRGEGWELHEYIDFAEEAAA